MSETQYIGIFDSGLGGLTVAKSIIHTMPEENILYFGDTAHVPYGTKSHKQIRELAVNDVRFLSRFPLKAVVVACNTADSVAMGTLQEQFDLPIFGVIEPASHKAARTTRNNRIGIMATSATVRSGAYEKAIHRYNENAQVFQKACPLLVPLVENGRYRKDDPVVQIVLKEYLDELTANGIDTLVLGCTHYPLLSEAVQSIVPELTVISSSEAAADALKRGMKELGLCETEGDGIQHYYVSDDAEHFEENARVFLGEDMKATAELAQI